MSDYTNENEQNNEIELSEQDLEQVSGASGGGYPYYPEHYFEQYHHVKVQFEYESDDYTVVQW